MAAVVLSSEDDYFSTATLRRTRSQTKLAVPKTSAIPFTPSSADGIHDPYSTLVKCYAESSSSSAPSSPRTIQPSDSTDASFVSTPGSNISYSDCDDAQIEFHPDDHFVLPDYELGCYPPDPLGELEPPPSPRNENSYTPSPDNEDSGSTARPESPADLSERAEDDTAIKAQPTRHVDYLSHNWTEEEIWSSWRYIVSRRKDHMNSVRLENASWRTWLKKKNGLKTVSPETLNWLKECDVTWLYGPLQTREGKVRSARAESGSSTLPKTNSFINKKPILKKRSMSEIMLRRSLSSSSLLKQAAAAVQAQEKDGRRAARPALCRATTDYITFPLASTLSRDTSLYTSSSTSGVVSPTTGRKRIHFNEKVEQCIAVDVKCDDDGNDTPAYMYDGSESDDGGVMMKRTMRRRRKGPMVRKRNKVSSGRTIAKLPSTTLKDRHVCEETETAMKHSTFTYQADPIVSPSSSQETLRADGSKLKKSRGWFFGGDESDEEPGYDFDGAYGKASQPTGNGTTGPRRAPSGGSLDPEPTGMRRTPSGMFMPCDEAETPVPNDGVFSRILDTVNTARDIAHVIWNVGWRK